MTILSGVGSGFTYIEWIVRRISCLMCQMTAFSHLFRDGTFRIFLSEGVNLPLD